MGSVTGNWALDFGLILLLTVSVRLIPMSFMTWLRFFPSSFRIWRLSRSVAESFEVWFDRSPITSTRKGRVTSSGSPLTVVR